MNQEIVQESAIYDYREGATKPVETRQMTGI